MLNIRKTSLYGTKLFNANQAINYLRVRHFYILVGTNRYIGIISSKGSERYLDRVKEVKIIEANQRFKIRNGSDILKLQCGIIPTHTETKVYRVIKLDESSIQSKLFEIYEII